MSENTNKELSSKVKSAIFFNSKRNVFPLEKIPKKISKKSPEENTSSIPEPRMNIPKNIMLGGSLINKMCSSELSIFAQDVNIKVTLMSTFGIKCGIATYTSYLLNAINKERVIANVMPFVKYKNFYKVDNDILHLQHEFGIMPTAITTNSNIIVTFHTISTTPKIFLKQLESKYKIVSYIVHFNEAEKILRNNTKKPIYIIPHGSVINPYVNTSTKKEIREKLNFSKYGISNDDKCAFVFGFQSGDKNYNRIIEASKITGIKLIISGGKHECGFTNKLDLTNGNKIIFLGKFLTDDEIDMFSFACDLLIFDYVAHHNAYSCSGAMHRVVGSGNPVICSRVNHFMDIPEYTSCLKFINISELILKIQKALELKDEFSKKALDYANNTTWEIVAKQHLDVYRQFADIDTVVEKVIEEKVVGV